MRVTLDGTTTQVLVKAYTTLLLDDCTLKVKQRTARIRKATVHWIYQDGEWQISFVHLWGPVVRKSDGAESTQHVSETTKPAGSDGAGYGVPTPVEIVEAALAHVPDWEPRINETPYPRAAALRSSL